MRHDSDAGATPDVFLIPCRGCVVHPDHTFSSVDLRSSTGTEHLTGAGDQGTLVTVNVQELLSKTQTSGIFIRFSCNLQCYSVVVTLQELSTNMYISSCKFDFIIIKKLQLKGFKDSSLKTVEDSFKVI